MDISLNSYSLRNEKELLGSDFLGSMIKVANGLDIKKAELLDGHIVESELDATMKRFEENGIQVFAFAPHTKALAKPEEYDSQIADGKHWIDLAHKYGVKYLRFQLSNGPLPRAFAPMDDFDDEEWEDYNEMMEEAIGYTTPITNPLLSYAEDHDVYIGFETHHSFSSNYVYMKLANKAFSSKHFGWIFDIGNYENDTMRWKALDVIKERTFYLHAKAYTFDEQGFETQLDYPKACQILKDAGFDGVWSIEFEGKMNGILGASRTTELIRHSFAKVNGQSYSMKTTFPSDEELIAQYKI